MPNHHLLCKFVSILSQVSMKLHSKLGSFLRILTKLLQRLPTIRAVDGAIHSQKVSVEANVRRSSAKVSSEHAVLMVSGFRLAPRPGIYAILDLYEMDVPLIGCELTGVPDLVQRLVGWCCC